MLHIKCGVIFFVKFIQKTLTYYQIFYIIIVLGKILKKDIRKKGNVENEKNNICFLNRFVKGTSPKHGVFNLYQSQINIKITWLKKSQNW